MDDPHRRQQSPENSPPSQSADSAPDPEAGLAGDSSRREFILKIYLASAAAVVLLSLAIWLMMLLV